MAVDYLKTLGVGAVKSHIDDLAIGAHQRDERLLAAKQTSATAHDLVEYRLCISHRATDDF